MPMTSSLRGDRSRGRAPSVLTYALPVGLLGAALVAATTIRSGSGPARSADSAPGRSARRWRGFGEYTVTGRTVTINRPRAELYAVWRDFTNLPGFMEGVQEVRTEGGRTVWTLNGAGDRTHRVVTEMVSERENEQIAWRSVEGSELETRGKVSFRDAPGNRGTEVEAIIAYKPPAGAVGRLAAMVLQEDPAIQARRDLKRFKMLMETGEIATSANRRSS